MFLLAGKCCPVEGISLRAQMFRSAEVYVQFAGHPPHSVGGHIAAVPNSDLCNVWQQQVFLFWHFFPTVFSLHQCCIGLCSPSKIQCNFSYISASFFFLPKWPILIVLNQEWPPITNIWQILGHIQTQTPTLPFPLKGPLREHILLLEISRQSHREYNWL